MSYVALLPFAAAAVGFGLREAARRSGRTGQQPKAAPKAVPIDRAVGDEELRRLQAAGVDGDWASMAAILEPVRARKDHDRLSWLIANTVNVEEFDNGLVAMAEERPDDALVRSVAGARCIAWAWEARSSARASQVSREQFATFHDRLRIAEDHLYAAVELDPESAVPWACLTTTARGLEHGQDVAMRRFEAGAARAPYHVALHQQYLQQICRKWGGSHEEMHAFARRSMLAAPPGSELGELVATAHIEHWLDSSASERAEYVRRPKLVAELKEAAALSIDHPDFAPTTTPYTALNSFAFAYWMADRADLTAEVLKRIGDHATKFPWGYVGSPGVVFATARRAAKQR